MNRKDKIKAEIEAKLGRCNRTLTEVKNSVEKKGVNITDALGEPLPMLQQRIEWVESRLEELEKSQEGSWSKLQAELEGYMRDIDNSLRNALGYYK